MQTRYVTFFCRSILLTHNCQVIKLDPLSPWGYEMKHASLHQAGEYKSAVHAFEAMLSKMEESPDPDVHRGHIFDCHDDNELIHIIR